eukprot:2582909-Rhodomonas_salina.4
MPGPDVRDVPTPCSVLMYGMAYLVSGTDVWCGPTPCLVLTYGMEICIIPVPTCIVLVPTCIVLVPTCIVLVPDGGVSEPDSQLRDPARTQPPGAKSNHFSALASTICTGRMASLIDFAQQMHCPAAPPEPGLQAPNQIHSTQTRLQTVLAACLCALDFAERVHCPVHRVPETGLACETTTHEPTRSSFFFSFFFFFFSISSIDVPSYAVCGTEIAYGAGVLPDPGTLPSALPMPCPVLAYAMLICHVRCSRMLCCYAMS